MTTILILSPEFIENTYTDIKKSINNHFPLMWDEEFENINNNNYKNLCGICLTTRTKNKKLKCKHIFCKNCIEKWLKYKSKTCPNCRKKI